MNQTLEYYNNFSKEFTENTVNVDFQGVQNRFLQYLQPGARILDFGCGSGRDSKAFLDAGYEVEAIDGSLELCKIASKYIGQEVKHQLFQDLNEVDHFDGIWASASILHLDYDSLKDVFNKIFQALKPEGYLYASFKYGEQEGERDGRYFTNMTEEKFGKFLEEIGRLEIVEQSVGEDCRPGRENEKWINVILKK